MSGRLIGSDERFERGHLESETVTGWCETHGRRCWDLEPWQRELIERSFSFEGGKVKARRMVIVTPRRRERAR